MNYIYTSCGLMSMKYLLFRFQVARPVGVRLDPLVNTGYTSGMGKKTTTDPAMDKVRSMFTESGLSLVDLGKRMGYAEETARQAAWQFMKTSDPRVSMLRRFADAMGVPLDSLLPRGKRRMLRKLEIELSECDCELTRGQFHDMLERVLNALHPTLTADELVCHPDHAKAFCEQVRSDTKCPKLFDFLILRTLLNARKAH